MKDFPGLWLLIDLSWFKLVLISFTSQVAAYLMRVFSAEIAPHKKFKASQDLAPPKGVVC